jgi:hypothetical protein
MDGNDKTVKLDNFLSMSVMEYVLPFYFKKKSHERVYDFIKKNLSIDNIIRMLIDINKILSDGYATQHINDNRKHIILDLF